MRKSSLLLAALLCTTAPCHSLPALIITPNDWAQSALELQLWMDFELVRFSSARDSTLVGLVGKGYCDPKEDESVYVDVYARINALRVSAPRLYADADIDRELSDIFDNLKEVEDLQREVWQEANRSRHTRTEDFCIMGSQIAYQHINIDRAFNKIFLIVLTNRRGTSSSDGPIPRDRSAAPARDP